MKLELQQTIFLFKESKKKDLLFGQVAWMTSISAFIFSLLYFQFGHPLMGVANISLGISLLLCLWGMKVFQRSDFIINLAITLGFCFLTFMSIWHGGMASPTLIWLLLVPVCAAIFSSFSVLVFFLLLSALEPVCFLLWDLFAEKKMIPIFTGSEYHLFAGISFVFVALIICSWMFMLVRAIALAVKEAEDSRSKLEELIHIMSHDIGNPLATILLFSNVIKQRHLDREGCGRCRKYVETIEENGNVIHRIISKVRTLNALECGKKSLVLSSVDLRRSFTDVEKILKSQLERKNIKLTVNVPEEFPQVKADEELLSLVVFQNLVSNSIKFSLPGDEIKILCEQQEKKVYIHVVDTGVGVPENIIPNIFSINEQTSRLGTEKEKGTGFGMPLVKNSVMRMDGDIRIKSREKREGVSDHGTVVTVILNCAS